MTVTTERKPFTKLIWYIADSKESFALFDFMSSKSQHKSTLNKPNDRFLISIILIYDTFSCLCGFSLLLIIFLNAKSTQFRHLAPQKPFAKYLLCNTWIVCLLWPLFSVIHSSFSLTASSKPHEVHVKQWYTLHALYK